MEDLIGKQLGPYQIVAQLGIGGMATVFKAYQPKMDRYVALKILPRHFSENPEFVSRFSQEARIIAQLEHPHILPVHDFGESDGYTYLVMRLVAGGSLVDLLKKQGKLELTQVNKIIAQVGDALDYAHQKGVIHRDFKPGNVLMDELGNCLLTDFGIAKLIESTSHLTHTGGVLGTPVYISPEQGEGKPIDNRSDIYSLGVVLYQMVTGDVPYKADTPMAVIYKHVNDPVPLPRKRVPGLSEAIERVILRSLAKNPEDRYTTATEFAQALQSAIDEPDDKTLTFKKQDQDAVHAEPEIEPSVEKVESTIKLSEEPVKTIIEPKEKVRAGKGWIYGTLAIIFLFILSGAGWYYYKNIFLSKPVPKVESETSGVDIYTEGEQGEASSVEVKEPELLKQPQEDQNRPEEEIEIAKLQAEDIVPSGSDTEDKLEGEEGQAAPPEPENEIEVAEPPAEISILSGPDTEDTLKEENVTIGDRLQIYNRVTETQTHISNAIKMMSDCVVKITSARKTERTTDIENSFPAVDDYGKLFERFFSTGRYMQKSIGSGFIISSEGHIITNYHIIEDADEVAVTLLNGKVFQAKILGFKKNTDIAVLKIESGQSLESARLGDSDNLKAGEWSIALGNPFNLGLTATIGSIEKNVSDTSSDYFIKTTSAIYHGNSGGPLINLSGEVIGICDAATEDQDYSGHVIPINLIKDIILDSHDTRLLEITQKSASSLPQDAGNLYNNTSIIQKRQLDKWINAIFMPLKNGSVTLITDDSGTSLGSGFFIDTDGHIITSAHVLEKTNRIKVKLSDGKEYEARIIGRDSRTDLALINIEGAEDIEPLPLGDSDNSQVGDLVMAIGNPFGFLENTVTSGIVSAKYSQIGNSSYDYTIQTDASIDQWSYGGPLVNIKGEVVGINTVLFSSTQTAESAGIGFATSINIVKDLLPQLKKGRVVRARVGLVLQQITAELKNTLNLNDANGVLVSDVIAGSPAEKAGLKRGDIIVSFDGEDIDRSNDFANIVSLTPAGKAVKLDIIRNGKKRSVQVNLEEFKENASSKDE